MPKSSFAALLLLTVKVGEYFSLGQSTIGESINDQENKYYSDALFSLANHIQSEFQNLKTYISGLENRIERQKLSG